jgi:hypothetical protein
MKYLGLKQSLSWLKITGVSFFSALFAWYMLRFFYGLTTLYFCYDLNVHARLLLSGVDFLNKINDPVWTRDAVITIYLSGPIMSLLLGMAFFVAYVFVRRKTQSFSFFLLWTTFYSFTMMFGTFVENGVQRTGVYRVSQLMQIGDVALVVSVVVALYFLYLTGISLGKLIMLSVEPEHTHEDRMRPCYFMMAFAIPWVLVFLVSMHELNFNLRVVYLLGIISLIPFLWVKGIEAKGIRLKQLSPFLRIDIVSTLLFLLGFLLLRQFLQAGIVLG